ncbi:Acyl-homoserine-lactone acylase [Marinobacter salarius]|uniref:penicillin acylase family protein n=1 Tax=Marinobacter salarius TaxID=1420917 RepID=UPI00125C60C1|nr:penicillin acylase family protein [Marinobacter salarius]VVT33057.1 Acyl-homoserine-lactone acylase [Marinobacter salarius]VXA97136.1 Acyl-homoserine-lactone acylase [Marinobacter salarius]
MKSLRKPFRSADKSALKAAGVALASSFLIAGCFDGSSSSSDSDSSVNEQLFPADGTFEATIRRTTNGVPHVKADNLASAAFGAGYAQTQDNVCLLAEAIVKARSERAKYFGPGPDDINVINDFSYKAQKILSGAEEEYPNLSAETRAMIEGFAAGYNQYVNETAPGDLPSECRDQPWVKEITPVDLFAHYRIVGQYASGALFATGAVFVAVPDGESPLPTPVASVTGTEGKEQESDLKRMVANAHIGASSQTDFQDIGLGSNAWGIGGDMSEQGKGALLANPHFPYTGHRRLYQVQLTVPGYLNTNGAGLLGTAIPLINFNENLAWSHTVTTSRRFTLYELTLKDGDNFTYIKDGEEKPITSETYQIEVNTGGPAPLVLEKTFYFSEYGPMLAADAVTGGALPAWGANGTAYTYRDANAGTEKLLDTWLQMSRASNLDEFQAVFENCGTTFWTNTTYADDQGNAYYIDSSSVPNLSGAALAVVDFKRSVNAGYNQLFNNGLTLLDGSKSRDDWVEGECDGLVPFEQRPQMVRTDWVQNSNDSYWSTNPDQFLTGFSPLFGSEETPLNPRTRIGISMLKNPMDAGFADRAPAGQDGKFGAIDLIEVIYNNRTWYTDMFLTELRSRCTTIGATPVNLSAGGARTVDTACDVLQSWDGVYNTDSIGAHVFRVFIANYRDDFGTDLTVPFDAADPVATPSTPSAANAGTADDTMLIALADGLEALDSVNIAYDSPLGDVQYYQPTGGVPPGGAPTTLGNPFPWHGGDGSIDGAFNAIGVVTSPVAEDTVFPRIAPSVISNTAGLSDQSGEGWQMARGTSWHFGLEFTEQGPVAYGLTSYSQSSDSDSTHFNDQSLRYSEEDYRQFWFNEADIEANLLANGEITITN